MGESTVFCLLFGLLLLAGLSVLSAAEWSAVAPRESLRPDFTREAQGDRDGGEVLIIRQDGRPGLQGSWVKEWPVEAEGYYCFRAWRRCQGVEFPQRCAPVRLAWSTGSEPWQLGSGYGEVRLPQTSDPVRHVIPTFSTPASGPPLGSPVGAEPEFPRDGVTDNAGWTEVSGVFRAPPGTTRAWVQLSLQWAPNGSVVWSGISLEPCAAPAPRLVRLAAANLEPRGGKRVEDNWAMLAPLIAEAGAQKADVLVFGEHVIAQGLPAVPGRSKVDAYAETIPGPTTDHFGVLAKQHDLYLVLGMYEREGDLVYNVAVLIGPEGTVVGTYRKVQITHGEVANGTTPGSDYPVFKTRFGTVGMLICWDLSYPEVSRELCRRGAEVLLCPVYGFQGILGQARAVENQTYLVTSIYCDDGQNPESEQPGFSGVISPDGRVAARVAGPGTIVVAEVDLNQTYYWPWEGDWRSFLARERRD